MFIAYVLVLTPPRPAKCMYYTLRTFSLLFLLSIRLNSHPSRLSFLVFLAFRKIKITEVLDKSQKKCQPKLSFFPKWDLKLCLLGSTIRDSFERKISGTFHSIENNVWYSSTRSAASRTRRNQFVVRVVGRSTGDGRRASLADRHFVRWAVARTQPVVRCTSRSFGKKNLYLLNS